MLLNVNYRVTDGDGDTVDGALTINVDDDTPVMDSRICLVEGAGVIAYGADPADLLFVFRRRRPDDRSFQHQRGDGLPGFDRLLLRQRGGDPISGAISPTTPGNPNSEEAGIRATARRWCLRRAASPRAR